MASAYPKISDEEMRFFQFKARQLCEKVKEEEAWLKHCSDLTHDGCSECDKKALKFKTVGVQAAPKRSVATSATLLDKSAEKEAALEELRIRLEKIELELEKIYGTPIRNAQRKLCEGMISKLPELLSPDEEEIFIKGGLKSCIAKINSLLPEKLKKTVPSVKPVKPIVKPVNSGYFLPHNLQKKREASRKAYLASLEVPSTKKQGVSDGRKNGAIMKRTVMKQVLPKAVLKTSNKPKVRCKTNSEENTLVQVTAEQEIKDPNIELVVDGILDDLLREAVVDLNRINLFGDIFQTLASKGDATQLEQRDQPQDSVNNGVSSSAANKAQPKNLYSIDSAHSLQPKYLLEMNNKTKPRTKEKGDRHQNSFSEDLELTGILKELIKNPTETCTQIHHKDTSPKTLNPKFSCGVSRVISLNPNKAKEIAQHADEYWKYLAEINHIVTENFNTWAFCNAIADSIVDDCINDVAIELCNAPAALIKFLYNQEFLQQVETQR